MLYIYIIIIYIGQGITVCYSLYICTYTTITHICITYIYTSMYVIQLHGKGWVDGHGVSATCKDIGDSMILLKQFKNTVFISWDEMEVVS